MGELDEVVVVGAGAGGNGGKVFVGCGGLVKISSLAMASARFCWALCSSSSVPMAS
jgi:hypothetical protein